MLTNEVIELIYKNKKTERQLLLEQLQIKFIEIIKNEHKKVQTEYRTGFISGLTKVVSILEQQERENEF